MSETLERSQRVGLTPEAYLELMAVQAAVDPATLTDAAALEKREITGLNLHRSKRLARTWHPSAPLTALVARLEADQTWVILTEPWCGDSAQCLPCLFILAAQRPDITVRLVLRDENLDLMDRYLTDGKRAIPRLVALAADGRELFNWGPRPRAAQAVVDTAKTEGLDKESMLERLHLFYGRDRGAALDAEWTALLTSHLAGET